LISFLFSKTKGNDKQTRKGMNIKDMKLVLKIRLGAFRIFPQSNFPPDVGKPKKKA
jgi:hypothetical protein